MRKAIIIAVIILAAICATMSAQDNKSFQLNGNAFTSQSNGATKAKFTYTPTAYTWDGDTIYLHTVTKGDNAGKTFAYVRKVSKKTMKPYWKKLPEEVVAEINKKK